MVTSFLPALIDLPSNQFRSPQKLWQLLNLTLNRHLCNMRNLRMSLSGSGTTTSSADYAYYTDDDSNWNIRPQEGERLRRSGALFDPSLSVAFISPQHIFLIAQ